MGVRHLIKALENYSVPTALNGRSVVIDGPALAYRIWESLVRDQTKASAILGQVTYNHLTHAVKLWLNRLRAHEVDVRKIYFDGYLPPRKWDVRRERLIKQSGQMRALTSKYRANGVRPENLRTTRYSSPVIDPDLGRVNLRPAAMASKAKTPFIVPSVIEALRCSPEWKAQVQLVPGEADAFCAEYVRKHGGTVLTGDSDLLIEDLGPEGSVAFFWDISEELSTEASAKPLMYAKTYSLPHIETRLGISGRGGLTRFAFEIKTPGTTFQQAVARAQEHGYESPRQEADYQDFLQEHTMEEYISADHPVTHVLSALDPRISELIIQSLGIQVLRQDTTRQLLRKPRGPDELSLFLPILVDDHKQKSAWLPSQTVRELAYGLAQHSESVRHNSVIEYKTLVGAYGGRRTDVPDAASTEQWCEQLVSTLERIETGLGTPDMTWTAFAIYLEMQYSIVGEERPSLTVRQLHEALRLTGLPESFSWDAIHFNAQVQASLYSLRILKQVLDVRASLAPTMMSDSQQQLLSRLSGLPRLDAYPSAMDMGILLRRFNKTNGLAVISNLLGLPPKNPNLHLASSQRKGPGQARGGQAGKPEPGNIFALLDEEGQSS